MARSRGPGKPPGNGAAPGRPGGEAEDDALRGVLERVAGRRAAWGGAAPGGGPPQRWADGTETDPLREALERLLRDRLEAVPAQPLPRTCEACNGPFGGHTTAVRLDPHDLDLLGHQWERPLEYFFCRRCAQQTRALLEWQRREAR